MLHDNEDLGLVASAARARVEQHRLEREREAALRRVRATQNLTAAWKPLSSEFLSAKAKLQPRDSKGRWIDMGATVRWLMGSQIGGDKSKLSGAHGKKSYATGKVTGFDPKTKKYSIKPTGGGGDVQLEGKDLEVIKAVIPDSPENVPDAAPKRKKGETFEQMLGELKTGDRFTDPEDGLTKVVTSNQKYSSDHAVRWKYADPDAPGADKNEHKTTVGYRTGGYGGQPEGWKDDNKSVQRIADRFSGAEDDGEFDDMDLDSHGAPLNVGDRVGNIENAYQRGTIVKEPQDNRGLWEIKMDNAGLSLFKGSELEKHDEGTRTRQRERDVTTSETEEIADFKQTLGDFDLDRWDIKSALRSIEKPKQSKGETKLFESDFNELQDALKSAIRAEKSAGRMSDEDEASVMDALQRFKTSAFDDNSAAERPAISGERFDTLAGNTMKKGMRVARQSDGLEGTVVEDSNKYGNGMVEFDNGERWNMNDGRMLKLPDAAAADAPDGETGTDPRKALAERAGLSDEEMDGAPELLPATEELRDLVTGMDFLDPRDLDSLNDYLDEAQVAPGGRSSGQWDSIESFLQEHKESLDEDQLSQIEDALAKARNESLDSPGDTTIDDLEKAVDQGDPLDTGVPPEWAEEKQFDDALRRLKPLTDEEKAERERGREANRKAQEAWDADPASLPSVPEDGPFAIGDRVTTKSGKSGIITSGRPDGERYVIETDDGEKIGAHPDDITVDESMDDALDKLANPDGSNAPDEDPGQTATDDNGDSIEIGDKVNWKQGIFGGKEYPVVDITPEGYPVIENPHWPVSKGGNLTTLKPDDEKASFTKALPDTEMAPEVQDALRKFEDSAKWADYGNDGYDKAASGKSGAWTQAAELIRKQGLTPEVVAELRSRAEKESHANDYAGFDDHNPYHAGAAKGYEQAAIELEKRLPKPAGETPSGNVTEFAKNMFQNLHPDANWDEADQTAWLDAAKKAMEKPND